MLLDLESHSILASVILASNTFWKVVDLGERVKNHTHLEFAKCGNKNFNYEDLALRANQIRRKASYRLD